MSPPLKTRLCAVLTAVTVFSIGIVDASERFAAQPILPNELIPRFVLDNSFPLAKRVGGCEKGSHPCEETGHNDQCCKDDTYCYINKKGNPKCCPIGSDCINDSLCKSSAYYCTQTNTVSGTITKQPGCCPRLCPKTSQYLCPSSKGCCGFGSECRDGDCVETIEPSSTALFKPIEEGCTTSQYKCADGHGCCDNDQSCTDVSGTGYCAPGRPTETGLEFIDDDSNNGLSDGAKAGIAVGTIVGAAIIIGGLTWLCLYKRKQRRRASTTQASRSGPGGSEGDAAPVTEVSQSSRPHQPGDGLTQGYFGPDAVAGPYTETTAQRAVRVAETPGSDRAVPGRPNQPGDIAAAVEIDSEGRSDYDARSQQSFPSPQFGGITPGGYYAPPRQPETTAGRFELYGSHDEEPVSETRSPATGQMPTAHHTEPRSEKEGG